MSDSYFNAVLDIQELIEEGASRDFISNAINASIHCNCTIREAVMRIEEEFVLMDAERIDVFEEEWFPDPLQWAEV